MSAFLDRVRVWVKGVGLRVWVLWLGSVSGLFGALYLEA